VIVDLVILPDMSLFLLRTVVALAGVLALLVGMIWEGWR
jgi:hypothetical protein